MWKSIEESVFDNAEKTPDRIAVIADGKEITYAELVHCVKCYTQYLKEKGISKGDIVVIKSSQTIDYVIIYLSVHLAGGAVAALEKSVANEEIAHVAQTIGAKMIISDDSSVTDLCPVIFADRGVVMETADGKECEDYVFQSEDDSADILYTTGTTGTPKGVELSHRALVAVAENLIYGCEYKKDFVLLVPGPLNHANPIRNVFAPLINGSTVYVLNGMTNMRAFYNAMDYPCERIGLCLPPPFVRIVFQLSQDKIGEYADKIDFIVSSTAPLPEADKIRLSRLLPCSRLYSSYGSSESGVVCMYDYNKKPGLEFCVGLDAKNAEVIVVDDDRKVMQSSAQNMGLIACRGAINMKGYINDPEMTEKYLQNGTFYTNDIGYINEEGYIFIIGRQDDVINVGGLKVAPSEVESMALLFPGIEDCICIGVDNNITGKSLKLLAVVKQGFSLDTKELRNFLMQKLEQYKVPQAYEQVDKIARTYNGKLDRKAYM